VDSQKRREKQRALMTELVERKIRARAQELYDSRGQVDGLALEDWVKAESEVLGQSTLAMLARRNRAEKSELVANA
jgi:hypothetical protein